MSSEQVIRLFQSLPESFQDEVVHFIEFLLSKSRKQNTPKPRPSLFGHAKGKIYMAPDFDDPLEDFKDYM